MNPRKEIGKVNLNVKIKRAIWNIAYIFLFRPFGTKLFKYWRVLILKMFGAKMKWSSSVYSSVKIWAPWNLIMRENAGIGPYCIVYNQEKVVIKSDAKVSQYVYLCTAGHRLDSLNNAKNGLIISSIIIEPKAWIGTRAYINMGVTIGEGAVVGATASVYKDVEAWAVVGGNPAKVIKKREMND